MPLFHRVLTINGRPQPHPEAPGGIQRRHRLFIECERRLADDPLAGSSAVGQPIGDGCGLEGLVAKVAPLFAREQSLIRWVALRGAFAELFIRFLDPTSAVASLEELEQVMGLEWVSDAQGEDRMRLARHWRTTLSEDQQSRAFGLAGSVLIRVEDYDRYSKMNVGDVNADPRCQISKAIALDYIVCSAVALLRLGIAQPLFTKVPEPDALSKSGWYAEPLFEKAERFWDGSDWTAHCRIKDGYQFIEASVPLA